MLKSSLARNAEAGLGEGIRIRTWIPASAGMTDLRSLRCLWLTLRIRGRDESRPYFVFFVLRYRAIYPAWANLLGSRSEGRPAGRPYIPFAFFAPFAVKFSKSESLYFVTLVPFVVNFLFFFGCGSAALCPSW